MPCSLMKPDTDPVDSYHVGFWLVLIAALGLLLRAWFPNVVQFGIDEATASSLATQIAHGRSFPLAGIRTSFGFLNPPTYLYFLAPFFAVTRDPAIVALVPMILGAAASALAGMTALRLGGARVALLAAIMVAICPNAVEHSRRLWGHDLQVFLGAVACWCMVEAWWRAAHHEGRPNRWLAGSFAAAAVAQTCHLSGALYWLPGLLLFASAPRRFAKGLAAGIVAALALYAPWLAHQIREGWPDLAVIAGALSGGAASRDLGHPVPALAAWFFVLGDAWNNDLLGARRSFDVVPSAFVALSAASGLAMFAAIFALATTRPNRLPVLALGLLLLATPLLFGVLFRAVVPPYLLPALVPAAILSALGVDRLLNGRAATVAAAAFAIYVTCSITYTTYLRLQMALGEGTTPSLAEKKDVVRIVDDFSQGRRFRLMQDARAAETGIDVAYIYLFHWRGISERYTTRQPEHLFVVLAAEPRTPAHDFLQQYGVGFTDHLLVHEVPPDAWEAWFSALRGWHQQPAP